MLSEYKRTSEQFNKAEHELCICQKNIEEKIKQILNYPEQNEISCGWGQPGLQVGVMHIDYKQIIELVEALNPKHFDIRPNNNKKILIELYFSDNFKFDYKRLL